VFDDADRAALARFRSGDPVAFRELVERYQRPVYNAAFWILRDAEDARDVAQTVFLTLAERADEYDPRHKLFSWIYRMAATAARRRSTRMRTSPTRTPPARSAAPRTVRERARSGARWRA
jgi:RNA polymerase sigma-70 factor (ECF subfamily)